MLVSAKVHNGCSNHLHMLYERGLSASTHPSNIVSDCDKTETKLENDRLILPPPHRQ